jgi:GT2 family glycosyltransferase
MIDIVIVNWNSGDYLAKCIRSVFASENENLIGKVVIIDNNSADGSAGNIIADNRITIIRNEENLGFSKACNQGFHICTSDYVLLLNPDAMLLVTTLNECINFMNRNKDVDILGCALLDDSGIKTKSCSRFPSPLRIFFDASGLSKIAPGIFNPSTLMTDWDHNESREVNQVMGAFMFMRRKLFDQIGFFDERFFVYYEEVDFSRRLIAAGGKIFYNKDIAAIHSGEGTTKSVKAFRLFLSLRSRLQYAKKHFNTGGYWLVWISTFLIEFFTRTISELLKANITGIKEIVKGYTLLIRKNTHE